MPGRVVAPPQSAQVPPDRAEPLRKAARQHVRDTAAKECLVNIPSFSTRGRRRPATATDEIIGLRPQGRFQSRAVPDAGTDEMVQPVIAGSP